jgi:hypothetical protein
MTVEHRLTVGLEDLKGIIFECRHTDCTARAVVSPDHAKVPEHCPACGKEWMRKESLAEVKVTSSVYVNLIENIAKLRAQDPSHWPKFRILLEFDEPK